MCDHVQVIYFRDKDEIYGTPIFRNSRSLKNFLNGMNNARFKNVPIFLKENCMVSI